MDFINNDDKISIVQSTCTSVTSTKQRLSLEGKVKAMGTKDLEHEKDEDKIDYFYMPNKTLLAHSSLIFHSEFKRSSPIRFLNILMKCCVSRQPLYSSRAILHYEARHRSRL